MKKVLITGAGGTVGMLLTTHFTDLGIPVVAVDRSEVGVANLLRIKLRQADPIVLDVRYGDLMKRDFVFEVIRGCDTIIHCAALKHVSVGSFFPGELATENVTVFGHIIAAVQEHDVVKKVLLCSSDKAAKPTSVMGASKFLLERMCQNIPNTKAKFFGVRFGNILGSSGSLSEVVAKCIEDRRPFLLTDFEMTRFILRKTELLFLITETLKSTKDGEICTLNLPSARVTDLVRVFSEMLGKEPPKIKLFGNTYFENVHESLFNEQEIKNVRQNRNLLIFNSKESRRISRVSEDVARGVVSSRYGTLDIGSLRTYIKSS